MANEEAEKKDIAKLSFNIDDAINRLEKVDKALKNIADNSEKYGNIISKNLNNKLTGIINTDDIQKNANKAIVITKDMQEKAIKEDKVLRRHLIEQNNEANNKIRIQNNETANEQILNNEKVAKSTETLYDKISKYAKTYIIYQGFNMLKQAISESIEEMSEVQYKMVEIDRVMNVTGMDVDGFRDKLIQLAYDYGNAFENVSDISLRLAQAGIKEQANLALTEKTLLALNTAELDATEATDDMVAVMSQWNLITDDATQTAKSYGDIIDKINKVADNFPTKSADILDAMKKTSNVFNLAGASIDETIATIVAAEKASQRGGKAIGTALSNISQQIRAEGKLNLAEQLGLDFYTDETKTKFKNIIDIFKEMAERIQELKDSGRESSVEMQKILELFTVFRRNIGASLLGEMAGEESTYAKVLETSINSIGYSYQENEKYMKTATAAQEQFNAELLKLKTQVWDNGLEDVYRSMLLLGGNIASGIGELVKQFGALPVAVASATLALSLFSKKMKLASYDAEKGAINVKGFIGNISNIKTNIKNINALQNSLKGVQVASSASFKTMAANMTAYGLKVASATIKTLALKAATLALNVAATAAATAGIMVLTQAIQEMISKQQTAIELQKMSIQSTEDRINSMQEEKNTISDLIKSYDEIGKKESRTPEETSKIYEIQLKIKNILGEQAKAIDLVNGKYEEQKNILNEVSLEQQRNLTEELKKIKEQKQASTVGYELPSKIAQMFGGKDYEYTLMKYGRTGLYEGSLSKTLKNVDFDGALELFTKWEESLRNIQSESVDLMNTYNWVNTVLNSLKDVIKETDEATMNYEDSLAKLNIMEMFPEGSIENAEQFNEALNRINETDFDVENIEEYREKLSNLISSEYPEFVEQIEISNNKIQDAQNTVNSALTTLQEFADKFNTLQQAQEEYNSAGELTISTFQSLINNDLLQYLSIQDGQLKINTQSMEQLAEETKINAIAALQSAAANDIEKAALGDLESMSTIAKGAIANLGNNVETAGNQAQTSATKMLELASAIQATIKASQDQLADGVDLSTFQSQANAISNAYLGIARNISNINIATAKASGGSTRSGGGGGSSSSSAAYSAQKEAEAAAKAAEEEYKKKLDAFKKYITEKERLEKRWVDKEKELGLLSNKDYLYITQQRIERYKQYLEEVRNATWMKDEDRLELEKSYLEKVEDLQVDYLGYLKDIQEDEIKALEKANDEKIDLIKEEADARIAALRAVESENDRIRDKEDYERRRAEHLEDISYWEQRTGRQAQEALKEAKEKLKELDEQWERQMQDWSIEDQIKAIEEERDAQVKAIEDAQEAEINSIKEVYDAKVKLFGETGQIIYEGSVIQSQNLYNAYKSNFIDPIKSELQDLNKVVVPEVQQATPTQEYETYLIKSGDTLSAIAGRYGTTVDKIMAANPYITNKNRIYAGKTLQIPKFHEGGIFEGVGEGLALLKKGEVVLRPEWSASLDRMMKYFDNITNKNTTNITNGPTITVEGDMLKVQANISSKGDADYLTKRLEKMLKDKFNIKK